MAPYRDYPPDEQDEIVGEAMAVGGPEFASYVQANASEMTDQYIPWQGLGQEPAGYRALWLILARRLVEQRRAALGLPRRASDDDDGDAATLDG